MKLVVTQAGRSQLVKVGSSNRTAKGRSGGKADSVHKNQKNIRGSLGSDSLLGPRWCCATNVAVELSCKWPLWLWQHGLGVQHTETQYSEAGQQYSVHHAKPSDSYQCHTSKCQLSFAP
jgi:hypothetical protein